MSEVGLSKPIPVQTVEQAMEQIQFSQRTHKGLYYVTVRVWDGAKWVFEGNRIFLSEAASAVFCKKYAK